MAHHTRFLIARALGQPIATITTLFTAKSDRSTVMFHSDAVSLEIDNEGVKYKIPVKIA